jgi:hypothetical protein
MQKNVKKLLDFALQDLNISYSSSVFGIMFRFMFLEQGFGRTTRARSIFEKFSFVVAVTLLCVLADGVFLLRK